MKTLLLVRHAKTESPFNLKRDFDRRLTVSGVQDAKRMGEWLKTKYLKIDWILSSPAERTRQTTEEFCEAMSLHSGMVEYRAELYHTTPEIFFQLILSIDEKVNTLLVVSHNDGITHFANQLTDVRIDCMQPGSVFAVGNNTRQWSQFLTTERNFLFYKQP